jgi:diguanylate cyclase (GGDEF)-like protein
LTGIANRRAFLEEARALNARPSTAPKFVAVLLADLDHFKSINDRFGHSVGDRVLQLFAKIAGTKLGPSDLLGRLGGEEFAIVLGDAGCERGLATADAIRLSFAVAATEIGGHAVGATVSIGMVVAEQGAFDLPTLLARADAALYRAKEHGRNRVEVVSANAALERAEARREGAILPLASTSVSVV